MPTRPPRVCNGCGEAVTGRCTRCDERAWSRKPPSWTGGSTRRWRKFRAMWMAEHPLCAGHPAGYRCGAVGEEVDHITPLSQYPESQREGARYDERNVQTLCKPCHRRKTAEESASTKRIRRAQDTTGQLW